LVNKKTSEVEAGEAGVVKGGSQSGGASIEGKAGEGGGGEIRRRVGFDGSDEKLIHMICHHVAVSLAQIDHKIL